jgi:hypothetical protein
VCNDAGTACIDDNPDICGSGEDWCTGPSQCGGEGAGCVCFSGIDDTTYCADGLVPGGTQCGVCKSNADCEEKFPAYNAVCVKWSRFCTPCDLEEGGTCAQLCPT